MISELDRLIDDASRLKSKLILLISQPRSGKSALLAQLSELRDTPVVNIGAELGRKLLQLPSSHRRLRSVELLKSMADQAANHDLLLLDNIELLFDRGLLLSPLDLLKRHARVRRVVAVWPGDLRKDRLSYATTGHPEHQDYGIDGLVPFKIH